MAASELRPNQRNKYQALWEFGRGIADVHTTPLHLQIARSNLCNFKCVYCIDHREGNQIARTTIAGGTWERLLALIPRSESLAFHGISEFMIDPQFFDIVRRCSTSGATLSLNTNGSVCTPKYLDALGSYPGDLLMNFSMDAATPETYLRIRGGDFWRIVRNIKTYVERFETRQASTWLSMSFVITKSSVADMMPMVLLAKALKMHSVKYYRLHEYSGLDWRIEAKAGGTFDYREESTIKFSQEYNRAVEKTRRAAEVLGISIQLPAPVTEAEPMEAIP